MVQRIALAILLLVCLAQADLSTFKRRHHRRHRHQVGVVDGQQPGVGIELEFRKCEFMAINPTTKQFMPVRYGMSVGHSDMATQGNANDMPPGIPLYSNLELWDLNTDHADASCSDSAVTQKEIEDNAATGMADYVCPVGDADSLTGVWGTLEIITAPIYTSNTNSLISNKDAVLKRHQNFLKATKALNEAVNVAVVNAKKPDANKDDLQSMFGKQWVRAAVVFDTFNSLADNKFNSFKLFESEYSFGTTPYPDFKWYFLAQTDQVTSGVPQVNLAIPLVNIYQPNFKTGSTKSTFDIFADIDQVSTAGTKELKSDHRYKLARDAVKAFAENVGVQAIYTTANAGGVSARAKSILTLFLADIPIWTARSGEPTKDAFPFLNKTPVNDLIRQALGTEQRTALAATFRDAGVLADNGPWEKALKTVLGSPPTLASQLALAKKISSLVFRPVTNDRWPNDNPTGAFGDIVDYLKPRLGIFLFSATGKPLPVPFYNVDGTCPDSAVPFVVLESRSKNNHINEAFNPTGTFPAVFGGQAGLSEADRNAKVKNVLDFLTLCNTPVLRNC